MHLCLWVVKGKSGGVKKDDPHIDGVDMSCSQVEGQGTLVTGKSPHVAEDAKETGELKGLIDRGWAHLR